MQELEPIILGIIQGVTEFLPISSTAHLILTPWLFSWGANSLPFDVSLHVGSLFAILFYFRKDWYHIISNFALCSAKMSFSDNSYGRLGLNILIATIPAAVCGLIFEEYAAGLLRSPVIVAFLLIIFAIILYLGDTRTSGEKTIHDLTLKDALVFGVSQAFAIMPGVSRSGVTITGGLLRNYRRDEATRFSFILGAPLITGAAILESRHLSLSTISDPGFIFGVLSSGITSFFVIKYLLKYIQTNNFNIFVVYRIVLGIFIILFFNLR